MVLQQSYVQRKNEKGIQLCSQIRQEFTESIMFEKGHDSGVAMRSRVFVSCILTPLPTDSSEANNSFTGFMEGKKKKKKRTIFPEELGNNAKLSKSTRQLHSTKVYARVSSRHPSLLLPSHLSKTLKPMSQSTAPSGFCQSLGKCQQPRDNLQIIQPHDFLNLLYLQWPVTPPKFSNYSCSHNLNLPLLDIFLPLKY